MEILYSENDIVFVSKPTYEDYKTINFTAVKKSIEELVQHIEGGKAFSCGVFSNDWRTNNNFIGQCLFAVDFDKGITLPEAEAMLSEYDLTYNFGYYTIRHTDEKPRFRLVFVLDEYVTGSQQVKEINLNFHKFYDMKSDKASTDASRIFLGSNNPCFHGNLYQEINLQNLMDKINLKIYSKDKNRSRYCMDINSILTFDGRDVGFPIKEDNSINHNSPVDNNKKKSPRKLIDNWEIQDLLNYEVFRLFYEGKASGKEDKLSHDELFGIATNLAPLKGGQKLFNELLQLNKNYSQEKYSLIGYVINRRYPPKYIGTFSPYQKDIDNSFQTFSQAVKKKGQIKINKTRQYIELEEAEKLMDQHFEQILETNDNKIYLIKCGAGLGKTNRIKNLKNVVIAFPDHQLKEEHFHSSSLLTETEKLMTPKLKGIFSAPVADRMERYYKMDLSKHVMIKVKMLANGESIFEDGHLNPKDVAAANEFLEHQRKVEEAENNKTIFTTHSKAILTDFFHDTIIYDEDPSSCILPQHSVLISELNTLVRFLTIQGHDCKKLSELLNQSNFNLPRETPDFGIDKNSIYERCVEAKFTSHVLNFFNSEYYAIDNMHINYSLNNTSKFRIDKKYIICDATAQVELYKKLFGDRLVYIDISNVKNKGKIIQYTKYSCSRTGLPKYVDEIYKQMDLTLPTLTFKDSKHLFPNATPELHLGKVRGSNILSGQNINVVGTQHYQPDYYKFLSKILKLEVNNFKMEYLPVDYNGLSFKFMTFSDSILQKIHLETVEGEQIQGVQRSRLIRHDATVYLYSNFPLEQAIYRY